ncbi:hypothetical protein [Pseudogemmobacter bohemicus]|uniref:hypothetical protein n=1 Tax=Pseudogemmobacter bohemicus TaxID=2250708 RepID=UPI000DD2E0A2|nr:hypothetical protein [Pseudogemmobacter bohemicus]
MSQYLTALRLAAGLPAPVTEGQSLATPRPRSRFEDTGPGWTGTTAQDDASPFFSLEAEPGFTGPELPFGDAAPDRPRPAAGTGERATRRPDHRGPDPGHPGAERPIAALPVPQRQERGADHPAPGGAGPQDPAPVRTSPVPAPGAQTAPSDIAAPPPPTVEARPAYHPSVPASGFADATQPALSDEDDPSPRQIKGGDDPLRDSPAPAASVAALPVQPEAAGPGTAPSPFALDLPPAETDHPAPVVIEIARLEIRLGPDPAPPRAPTRNPQRAPPHAPSLGDYLDQAGKPGR